jgi:hypothetical protein
MSTKDVKTTSTKRSLAWFPVGGQDLHVSIMCVCVCVCVCVFAYSLLCNISKMLNSLQSTDTYILVYACNQLLAGRKMGISRPAWRKLGNPISKTKYKQRVWGHGSSGRAFTKHMSSPGLKSQYQEKNISICWSQSNREKHAKFANENLMPDQVIVLVTHHGFGAMKDTD